MTVPEPPPLLVRTFELLAAGIEDASAEVSAPAGAADEVVGDLADGWFLYISTPGGAVVIQYDKYGLGITDDSEGRHIFPWVADFLFDTAEDAVHAAAQLLKEDEE